MCTTHCSDNGVRVCHCSRPARASFFEGTADDVGHGVIASSFLQRGHGFPLLSSQAPRNTRDASPPVCIRKELLSSGPILTSLALLSQVDCWKRALSGTKEDCRKDEPLCMNNNRGNAETRLRYRALRLRCIWDESSGILQLEAALAVDVTSLLPS